MNDLRVIVTQKLRTVTDRVFFEPEQVEQGTLTPYVVFSFPSTDEPARNRSDVALEIDIFDTVKDGYNIAQELEGLTDRIDGLFYYAREIANGKGLIFIKAGRFKVPDPNPNVWRRRLRYIVKTINTGE